MPRTNDFRPYAFAVRRVKTAGKFVGNQAYWKLYAIENIFRVIIHSTLSAQIDPGWWEKAVDEDTRSEAERFRQAYLKRPWHTFPGGHGIYYTQLGRLNEIIRANSHLFLPRIPDIDDWIAKIEQVRLPRNIVAHMNYPSGVDRQRINVLLADARALVGRLQERGLAILIP